eukprot:gene19638-26324_t
MFAQNVIKYKVEKGCTFTHTSLAKQKGSFFIAQEDEMAFFDIYRNALQTGEPLHFTERHRELSLVLLDFDFRFDAAPDTEPLRAYTIEHIEALMQIYCEVMVKFVDIKKCTLYIMEKPGPRLEKGKVKDGIHVVIPDVITRPSIQHMVRRLCLPLFKATFDDIGSVNPPDDVFDEAVISTNNWQMYGSSKDAQPAYEVTHVYEYEHASLQSRPLSTNRADYVELLSIRNKFDETVLREEKVTEVAEWEKAHAKRKKAVHQPSPDDACVKNESRDHGIADLFNVFKVWQRENNPDTRMPNRKEFIKMVAKVWGQVGRGKGGTQGWGNKKITYNPYGDGGNDENAV